MEKQLVRDAVIRLLRAGLGKEAEVPEVQDWPAVYDLALRQDVLPFVFDGYVRMYDGGMEVPAMPVADKKKWIASVYRIETASKFQWKKMREMASVMSAGDIRTYILKGYVVAECYPNPAHRRSSDIDCFLLPAVGKDFNAWEKGNRLMEEKGYKVRQAFYKNSSFRIPGLLIENHAFLTPFRGNKRLTEFECLLQRKLRADEGKDEIGETGLYRPPVLVSALFLVEHAFSHFLHEGLTLRHMTDWSMFLARHGKDMDMEDFDHAVDAFGFRRFYDAFLHVGDYVLGARETLSADERRMLDSVWEGMDIPETDGGVKGKLILADNYLRSAWKYRLFSPDSMVRSLWMYVKGGLFDRYPVLSFEDGE